MLTRRIRDLTVRNIVRYRGAPPAAIESRIRQLESEWNVERAVVAAAAVAIIAGGVLLLQYALRGGSPAFPALRRWGFRTRNEIEAERRTLRRMLQRN
jgi:hypothetical protein